MQVLSVIPARWQSSRFPGKPLVPIAGVPMIVRVWRRAAQAPSVDAAVVATDDERIAAVCREHGIDVEMTSAGHATGSDRLAEVAARRAADVYVNVQGDEPLIDPGTIDAVVTRLREAREQGTGVATAYRVGATAEQQRSASTVHLLPGLDGHVIVFSRHPVPYCAGADYPHTVHVGLYAYAREALAWFAATAPGPVERAESVEPLRFLEHGRRVACVRVDSVSLGVDEPADVARVEALLGTGSKPR